jgi:glycosyltransferase involved in cell wall biosynthesis
MKRLRVLIVSPTFPYPPSWGFGMRVYQLARYLSERHDVTLLSYARADEMVHVDSLRAQLGEVRAVERPQSRGLTKRLAQLTSIASSASYQVRDLHTVAMQRAIDELLSSQRYDIIQLESSQMCGFRYPSTGALVLDEHNIEYELLQRMQQGERSWTRRLYNRVEYRKFRPIEQQFWRKVDGCAVTSEREEAIVQSNAPSTPVTVVSNGVDPDFFMPSGIDSEADTLVFNGLLSYRPNFDAASYLVEDVMPRIDRIRPGVTLTLVGYGTPSELESLRRPNVVLTGMVPDVRPYLERAAVVVVPIRMGGGTRLKVVEALAMAKAVVSTTIGCEGLRVRDGEHLLKADDANSFASSVALLLSDTARAETLGRAGRALMVGEYSWQRSAECLEDLYRRLASTSGSDPTHAPGAMPPDDCADPR